jgi:hypothetical protein
MALTEHESGTASLTLDTPDTLNTTSPETTDGAFCLVLDLSALAAGDILVITIQERALSGGTTRTIWQDTVAHDQGAEEMYVTPFLPMLHGWNMILEQTDGTGRSIPWSIRKAN